jgi:hypothetical protein
VREGRRESEPGRGTEIGTETETERIHKQIPKTQRRKEEMGERAGGKGLEWEGKGWSGRQQKGP